MMFLFKIVNNLLPEYLKQPVKFGAEVQSHLQFGTNHANIIFSLLRYCNTKREREREREVGRE